jgi:putative ABC transport system permease protein
MLEVKNLTKIYQSKSGNRVVALNGINLKFPESGLIFILGKSGSGKSTFLNVVSGLDAPDGGEIIIADKSSKHFTEKDLDAYRNTYLGFIFQEYNIINEFSVRDNIALALELQNKPPGKEVIEEILQVVGLEGFGERKPNELSGGQKQRVAIARALVKNPNVIFADEPTGNLDSASSAQIFDFLKLLSKKKLIIVVSHDAESAEKYGDRIIELSDGIVISDKTFNEQDTSPKARKYRFAPTKVIKMDSDVRFLPINATLPAKAKGKIAGSNILNKKGRLAVTLILIITSLTLFGFAQVLAGYNLVDASLSSFDKMGITNVRIEQGKMDEYTGLYFDRSREVIAEETIEKVREKFSDYTFSKYYPFINMPIGISAGSTGSPFLPSSIRGVVITTEEGLAEMGYVLNGEFPKENSNQIIITDFMVFNLLWADATKLGYKKYNEEGGDISIADILQALATFKLTPEDALILVNIINGKYEKDTNFFTKGSTEAALNRIVKGVSEAGIGKTLKISGGTFVISGIIETGFEEYFDIMKKDFRKIITDPRILELQENINYYYGNFFAAEGFLDNLYQERILLTNMSLPSPVGFGDWLAKMEEEIAKDRAANPDWMLLNDDSNPGGIDIFYFDDRTHPLNLKDNEVLLSQDLFRATYNLDYNQWKADDPKKNPYPEYTLRYGVSNLDYEAEPLKMKVVGVIKDKRFLQEQDGEKVIMKNIKSPYPIVITKNVYDNIGKDIQKVGALYFRLSGSTGKDRAIISYLCDTSPEGDKLYHLSPISELLYTMSDALMIMQILFKSLSLILGVFSAVLLINFMSTSVMAKQREIGVLRALGCRSKDVNGIFLYEAGFIAAVHLTFTFIMMTVMTYAVNYLFKSTFARMFKNELVNNLQLLTLSVRPFLIVGAISLALIYCATLITTSKISRMRPVDAIKKA